VCSRLIFCHDLLQADVLEYYDQAVKSTDQDYFIPAVLRVCDALLLYAVKLLYGHSKPRGKVSQAYYHHLIFVLLNISTYAIDYLFITSTSGAFAGEQLHICSKTEEGPAKP
jgi:hypothetical protein